MSSRTLPPSTVTGEELRMSVAAFRAGASRGCNDTGRYRMRYFSWGAGPAVVFVHGMADAATAFVMTMSRLVDRFTCIGYELPNGTTDGSRLARYSLRDYSADLNSLLDHLKVTQAAIVGSSFGSTIALTALASGRDRFHRGILQSGFVRRPLNWLQRLLARSARYWPGWFADWPEIHSWTMRRIERQSLRSVPAEVVECFLRHGATTPISACAQRALTIDRIDLRPLLESIHVPVLLITGDRDPLVPPVCREDLARGIEQFTHVELAGCGHYPQFTHPELMAESIARFLNG